jgi:hypothetical protein
MDSTFVTLPNIKSARQALAADGCLLIPGVYSPATCRQIIEWMDSDAAGEGGERNYGDTELRIWDSQRKHPLLARFQDESNVFMSCLLKSDMESWTVLAIRNRALPRGGGELERGRWHIDSFRSQYKTFLFLVDVDEATGPFEFIPRSHAGAFKRGMALKGRYFRPSDFFTGKRAYARIPDDVVERLQGNGYPSRAAVCRAGTVMIVDTSAIHRARPCYEGTRYALTTYFR